MVGNPANHHIGNEWMLAQALLHDVRPNFVATGNDEVVSAPLHAKHTVAEHVTLLWSIERAYVAGVEPPIDEYKRSVPVGARQAGCAHEDSTVGEPHVNTTQSDPVVDDPTTRFRETVGGDGVGWQRAASRSSHQDELPLGK